MITRHYFLAGEIWSNGVLKSYWSNIHFRKSWFEEPNKAYDGTVEHIRQRNNVPETDIIHVTTMNRI